MQTRYARQIAIPGWGEQGQNTLSKSTVVVVGAGGLGFPVLSYLTAAGVGRIVLFEYDTVNETNLNRQLLYTMNAIGQPKVQKAIHRLTEMNPHGQMIPVPEPFSDNNAGRYLPDADLIIDCADNYETRLAIARAAHRYRKTMVHGAVAGFLGTVGTFNSGYGPCFQCVYHEKTDVSPPPVFGAMAGIVGSIQATEAIKILINYGNIVYNQILTIDMETGQFERVMISKREPCPVCS